MSLNLHVLSVQTFLSAGRTRNGLFAPAVFEDWGLRPAVVLSVLAILLNLSINLQFMVCAGAVFGIQFNERSTEWLLWTVFDRTRFHIEHFRNWKSGNIHIWF